MKIPICIERRTCARGLLGALVLPLVFAGCDSSGSSKRDEAKTSTTDPAVASTLPEGPALQVNAASNDAARPYPLDAIPSPDGETVYFAALQVDDAGNRLAAVYRTPAGGGSADTLATGDPLSAPVGITTSLDGEMLFVADPGTESGGAILTLPASGGAATTLAGTEGYRPQGVTVAEVKGDARVYFTGLDPSSGAPGVFSANPGGGDVIAIATGAPFGEPGGVTVTKDGDVYVADALAEGGTAAVIKVSKGTPTAFLERIGVGFPAGITTTMDEKTLVVSGLDPATKTDVVYFVDVSSGDVSALTDTINAFHEPAGVHRAHGANVFAWADTRANDSGTVYVLHP